MGNANSIAVAGSLEGLTKIVDGTLRNIDYQTLDDCAKSTFPSGTYNYVIQNGIDYTYTKGKCNGAFKISSVTSISSCDALTT